MAAMIKHRFSLSFLETFIPNSRANDYDNSDDISPPCSPYPGRRAPLSARLDAELHLACAQVVSNNIPSDAWLDDSTEMVDFDLPIRSVLPPPRPTMPLVPAPSKRSLRDRSWSGSAFRNISMPSFMTDKAAKRATISISRPMHIEDTFVQASAASDKTTALKKRASLHGLGNLLKSGRRRADTTSALDNPPQAAVSSSQPSKTEPAPDPFSIMSNITFPRPTGALRKAISLDNLRARQQSKVQDSVTVRKKHASALILEHEDFQTVGFRSYHHDVNPDHRMLSFIESDVARNRRSWLQSWLHLDRERRPDERSYKSHTPSRSLIGSRGRMHGRDVELDLPIEVPSAEPSRQVSIAARSQRSRRSSASSGVIPDRNPQTRSSWRPFRKSWHSFREASDDEGDIPGLRTMFRKSGGSLRSRRSGTILKDIPPLPGVNQTQEERPSHAPDADRFKHNSLTIRNKSIGKRRSAESFKSAENRGSVGSRASLEIRKSVDIRSLREVKRPALDKAWSHSELQRVKESEVMERCESPTLVETPSMSRLAPLERVETNPENMTDDKSTPADSLLDGQVRQATAMTMRKAVVELSPIRSPSRAGELTRSPPLQSQQPSEVGRRSSVYSWLPTETRREPELTISRRRTSIAFQAIVPERVVVEKAETSLIAPDRPDRLDRGSIGALSTVSAVTALSFPLPDDRSKSRDDTFSLMSASQESFQDCLESQMGVPSTIPAAVMEEMKRKASVARQASTTGRKNGVEHFDVLRPGKYSYADDIDTLGQPLSSSFVGRLVKKKSKLWPFKQKKANTWMDEMEKLGIKDGVLLIDQLNGPPIVRY